MKKTILYSTMALAFFMISFLAKAQRGQENVTPESKAQKVTDHLKEKLNLNDDQVTKVYNLNLKTIQDTRAMKADKRTDMLGLKRGFSEIHSDYDKTMKSVLTAEQYVQWKKIQSDARAREQKEMQEQTGNKKYNPNEEDPEEEMTWEESED